ncbi:hypothetical protein [Paraburkholderia kururiensis]|uniref:Uncharacterized protein n=1 Tax=Paraburkholderia kururiensis TaxID=984307 RepID=A0ABZ0WME0_9BURK|nr:hypothetical protein [Paraburkholderia kururiensis]WQD78554.1 hypothetical protein U0042_02270 [Paraburkholderia kururiensis]
MRAARVAMSRASLRASWHELGRAIGVAVVPAAVAIAAVFAASPVTSANAAQAAASDPITPAEQLIFMAAHMQGIAPQTELDYTMASPDAKPAGEDRVRVLVTSPNNAKADAQVSDGTGAVPLPNSGLQCNPVIIYFLERDIAEMERLTGGKKRYFQQRLRLALAAGPTIETVRREVDGKPVTAQQIVVQPYLHDPNAARFPEYTGKRYTFLLASAVPGRVVQIRSEVPGANNDFAHPVRVETLSYQAEVRKLAPAPGAPASGPINAPTGAPAKPQANAPADATHASR